MLVVGEVPVGTFFERSDAVDDLVAGVTDEPATAGEYGSRAPFIEAVCVVPASGKCCAAGVQAPVRVTDDLDGDVVAPGVPGVQITAVSPVAGWYQSAVDQDDLPSNLALQQFCRTADRLGADLGHPVGVFPGCCGADTEILAQLTELLMRT